jgi:hypothetical protein
MGLSFCLSLYCSLTSFELLAVAQRIGLGTALLLVMPDARNAYNVPGALSRHKGHFHLR